MFAIQPVLRNENRRTSERALISIAVRKKVSGNVQLCQASNISSEGIFIAHVMDEQIPLRSKCWLEFSLPGSGILISARGLVVRQFVYARFLLTAIQFSSIAPSHRRLIESYIDGPHMASDAPSFLPPIPRG
jgi:PilZ domain